MVFGCSKCSKRDKDVHFYRIPKVVTNKGPDTEALSKRRRQGYYLSAIKRADITEKILANDRICSRHFITGKPASLLDETSPDWLPTLHLGHGRQISANSGQASEERWERVKVREAQNSKSAEATAESITDENEPLATEDGGIDVGVQTLLTSSKICECQNSVAHPFTESSFTDEDIVKFYTGLSKLSVLKAVFDHVVPPSTTSTKLSGFQEFILTIMKLRLDSPFRDWAYRFSISISTASRIFTKWLNILDIRLSPLIIWPDRESLWKTMPQCFRKSFGKSIAVIID